MSSYSNSSVTATSACIMICSAVLAAGLSGNASAMKKSQVHGLHTHSYETRSTSPTCNRIGSVDLDDCQEAADRQLIDAVTSLYAQMVEGEEPLGQEFATVLYGNLWDLYER